jgi:hypothetical protein
MPRKPSQPSSLVSPTGEKQKITILDLMQRLELSGVADWEGMCKTLNVDGEEAMAILDNLAVSMPRQSPKQTRSDLRGLMSWGVAIGYFYAKYEKPVILQ